QVAANPVYVQVGSGTTVVNDSGAKSTTVTVTQSQSVINWVPTDTAPTGGAIDLLPATHVWNFNGDGDYIVLNRFTSGAGLPLSRQIAISGTVNSYDMQASATQGGNIWFYNAGGILINNGAAINVGGLVLTTSDIDRTNGLLDDSGMAHFHESRSGAAEIAIARNASIDVANANPRGAYLAVVAPRIRQSGAVRIDGSAAYVAAEEVSIRFGNGLFDIDVVVGADGGTALVHDGSTTGPAHAASTIDQSRIYMVAVPKNDAVSMLVSGQMGYYDAVSAVADPNGAVILSGGYGIGYGGIGNSPGNGVAADIAIADARFRGHVEIHASGTLLAGSAEPASAGERQIAVEGNALFTGDRGASLTVGTGDAMTIDGDLVLQSRGAGGARVQVDGGQLIVGGDLLVSADVAAESFNDAGGGDAQGGTASIRLSGGTILAGRIIASADGMGGAGSIGGDDSPGAPVPGGDGGAGRGGNASITIEGAANVETGIIAAHAIGEGGGGGDFVSGTGISGAPGQGGEGRGGTAGIYVNVTAAGSVTTADLIVDASGSGGGGGEYYSFNSGPSAGGGVGGRGGDGVGGTATIALAAPVTASNQMQAVAQALGGDGGSHDRGGDGGNAFGGTAQAIVTGIDAGTGPVYFHVGAQGGDGGDGQDGIGGSGGNAIGGTARAQADGAGGRIAVTAGNFSTDGHGGSGGSGGLSFMAVDVAVAPAGGRGGDGTGGTIEIAASNGAQLFIDSESPSPTAFLGSLGYGGSGGRGSSNFSGPTGIGGDGGDSGASNGGTVRLIATGGTVSRGGSGPLAIAVTGAPSESGPAGEGPGGLGANGAETVTTGGQVLIEANAGPASPGIVELGLADIEASGDRAGRVVFRGNGAIHAAALEVRTRGAAAPTNGDVGVASAGIYLAPSGGGSIVTDGAMRLLSDGSIGIQGQAGAGVAAGGPLTLEAGGEVDIRHASRTGTAATLGSAADALSISAETGIHAAPGTLLAAATTLSLTT
ncbi:MAG: hypothetical protein CVT74_16500, partial [Alphaproteobacteria bacterium HGW-Alphaproteobacteria-13]